eukprot:PhM_4_TR9836/c3_g1_i1/m.18021
MMHIPSPAPSSSSVLTPQPPLMMMPPHDSLNINNKNNRNKTSSSSSVRATRFLVTQSNDFQWENVYKCKFGPSVYTLPSWRETYQRRSAVIHFNLQQFLCDTTFAYRQHLMLLEWLKKPIPIPEALAKVIAEGLQLQSNNNQQQRSPTMSPFFLPSSSSTARTSTRLNSDVVSAAAANAAAAMAADDHNPELFNWGAVTTHFQDLLLLLEKNAASAALVFCSKVVRYHFETTLKNQHHINDVGDDITSTRSLAFVAIHSYFRLHCVPWCVGAFSDFCVDFLAAKDVVLYTQPTTATTATETFGKPTSPNRRIDNIIIALTRFVAVLSNAPPLPGGMQFLLNAHQQRVNNRIRMYLESIGKLNKNTGMTPRNNINNNTNNINNMANDNTAAAKHPLHKNMINCAATLDILLVRNVLPVLEQLDAFGIEFASAEQAQHYHKNFYMFRTLFEHLATSTEVKDSDLFIDPGRLLYLAETKSEHTVITSENSGSPITSVKSANNINNNNNKSAPPCSPSARSILSSSSKASSGGSSRTSSLASTNHHLNFASVLAAKKTKGKYASSRRQSLQSNNGGTVSRHGTKSAAKLLRRKKDKRRGNINIGGTNNNNSSDEGTGGDSPVNISPATRVDDVARAAFAAKRARLAMTRKMQQLRLARRGLLPPSNEQQEKEQGPEDDTYFLEKQRKKKQQRKKPQGFVVRPGDDDAEVLDAVDAGDLDLSGLGSQSSSDDQHSLKTDGSSSSTETTQRSSSSSSFDPSSSDSLPYNSSVSRRSSSASSASISASPLHILTPPRALLRRSARMGGAIGSNTSNNHKTRKLFASSSGSGGGFEIDESLYQHRLQQLMRVNACIVRLNPNVFRYSRSICGDVVEGAVHARAHLIPASVEIEILAVLADQFQNMLGGGLCPRDVETHRKRLAEVKKELADLEDEDGVSQQQLVTVTTSSATLKSSTTVSQHFQPSLLLGLGDDFTVAPTSPTDTAQQEEALKKQQEKDRREMELRQSRQRLTEEKLRIEFQLERRDALVAVWGEELVRQLFYVVHDIQDPVRAKWKQKATELKDTALTSLASKQQQQQQQQQQQ